MRAYTAATAAFTLKIPAKALDNVLSHHSLSGVTKARQGVPRRLTIEAILTLAIAAQLTNALGTPLARAIPLAERLRTSPSLELGKGIAVIIDIDRLRDETLERLQHAVETVPIPRPARPRHQKKKK